MSKKQKQKEIFKIQLALILACTIVSMSLILGKSIMPTFNEYSVRIPKVAEACEIYEIQSEIIREVTAYNAGDPTQTDNSPCISANNTNICAGLANGKLYCAANFVPFGTLLKIDHYGICEVVDRMHSRYNNRVDVAFQAHEKERAVNFGKQNLKVSIVKRIK